MLGFIWTLIMGGVAGWLAGKIMNREGGTFRNVLLGLGGGIVGAVVLGFLGIRGHGMIGGTIVSVVGACILIWLGRNMK